MRRDRAGPTVDLVSPIHALRAEGGLVDLHCHVLPGIDDGAADLAGSLAMIEQAYADGIEVICATPHIRSDHDVVIHELPERVAALNDAARKAGLPVEIVTGGELAQPLSADLSIDELHAVSLGGTGTWILLEPGPGPMDDVLDAAVDDLHAKGVRCVIAHPERHAGADAADRLIGLVARGALVQVTAALLIGHGAAPTMLDWASQGLVHLVASDAHSATIGRSATIAEGLSELATVPRLTPHLDWIARQAPRDILAGREITPPF